MRNRGFGSTRHHTGSRVTGRGVNMVVVCLRHLPVTEVLCALAVLCSSQNRVLFRSRDRFWGQVLGTG